jgi:hypothetical protein
VAASAQRALRRSDVDQEQVLQFGHDIGKVRIEAYDAKSNESLTLIARGSRQAFEQAWNGSALRINDQLAVLPNSAGLQTSWAAYAAVHKQIRSLDDRQPLGQGRSARHRH